MDDIEAEIKNFQKFYDSLLPKGFQQLQKEIQKVNDIIPKFDLSPVYKSYIETTEKIGQIFKENYISRIYEELERSLQPLIDALKQLPQAYINYKTLLSWADYGWGLIDALPKEETYFKSVINSRVADETIEKYLTEDIIENLINSIVVNGNNSTKFEEAKKCFSEGKYTSCILILFSIIDAVCINSQKINSKRRKLADKQAQRLLTSEQLQELSISLYFRVAMPLKAIKVLFADGNDFINEPDLPNRNFLLHGMSNRDVTKIDCIKILSVLENLLDVEELLRLEEGEE